MASIQRNEGESFEDYQFRRALEDNETKEALAPNLFWNSYLQGTYENPQKREWKLNNTKHGKKQQLKGSK